MLKKTKCTINEKNLIIKKKNIIEGLKNDDLVIFDARSKNRFLGLEENLELILILETLMGV